MSQRPDSFLRVLIASPLQHEQVERIERAFPDRVRVLYEPDLLPRPRYTSDHQGHPPELSDEQHRYWRSLLAQADVLFDFDWEDPAHLLDHAPNLRWIQASGAGIGERVRQIGLPKDRILLTTSAGVHAGPLAEFALMAILYFAKDVPRLLEWQAKHHWERYCVRELAGSRALVLGLGGVGRRIAELYAALGIDVTGMRRSEADPLPPGVKRLIRRDLLDEVLRETDYLVIAVPHTRETHRLIDARRLSLLPPSAVLVNVGRGKVIDEPALIAALQDGRLHGAALDVFDQEPLPPKSPLWDMPNILLSPHSTSIVERENERIVDLFIENLRRYMDGRPLLNRFDYERGY